ncbi:MAG: aminotransferase class V-fold PLP-dependent enzyme [Aeromicrobium sp.]
MAILDVRDQFDIPGDRAYLNAAFLGPMPRTAVEAGQAALEAKAHPWSIGTESFFEPANRMRELLAAYLDGDPQGIAVIPAVSYGIATAAANVDVPAGSTIVVMAEQFPSNVYEWRAVAEQAGAEIITVHRGPEGWTPRLLEAIDGRTAVVAIEPAHWSDGTTVDLVAVGRAARAVEAAFIVDVSQTLGAVAFPLAEAKPDFVVGVVYKWLLGAYGNAFLWAAPHHREGRPLEHGWLPREGSGDFSQLAHYTDAFRPGAGRYDVGQSASHVNMASTVAALETLAQWSPAAVSAHASVLAADLIDRVSRLGLTPPPADQRSPHLVGLLLPVDGPNPGALAAALAEAQVNVSIRGTAVRVSAHVFNTPSDIDRLVDVLSRQF